MIVNGTLLGAGATTSSKAGCGVSTSVLERTARLLMTSVSPDRRAYGISSSSEAIFSRLCEAAVTGKRGGSRETRRRR